MQPFGSKYIQDKEYWAVHEIMDDASKAYLRSMLSSDRMKYYIEKYFDDVDSAFNVLMVIPIHFIDSDNKHFVPATLYTDSVAGDSEHAIAVGVPLSIVMSMEVIIGAIDAYRAGLSYDNEDWHKEYIDRFKMTLFHETIHAMRYTLGLLNKKTYKDSYKYLRDDDELRLLSDEVDVPFHQTFTHDYFTSSVEFYAYAEQMKYAIEILHYSPEEAISAIVGHVKNPTKKKKAEQYLDRMLWSAYAPTIWEAQEEAGQQKLLAGKNINWYKIAAILDEPNPEGQLSFGASWIDPIGTIYSVGNHVIHSKWADHFKEYFEKVHGIAWEKEFEGVPPIMQAGWIRVLYDERSKTWGFDVDSLSNRLALNIIADNVSMALPNDTDISLLVNEYDSGRYAEFYWSDFINSGMSFVDYVKLSTI